MKVYYFKIKEIDEKNLLSGSHNVKIYYLQELVNIYEGIMPIDDNGNTIFHNLVFLVEKSCPTNSKCLNNIVDSILESMPKEIRRKLLNYENNNKKTAFELALDRDLHDLMDKFLVYNVLDMEEDDNKMEEEIEEYLEQLNQIAIDHSYIKPDRCSEPNDEGYGSHSEESTVEVKSEPSSTVYNLRGPEKVRGRDSILL